LAQSLIEYFEAAAGKRRPTLLLKNALVVDVFTGSVVEGNLEIYKDRVIGLTKKVREADLVLDVKGYYLLPGFIDSHIHIESTLLVPQQLARLLLPHGVTTLMADPHEIANVLGVRGVRLLVEMSKMSKIRVFVQVPSRVPTAPGLETTGAALEDRDVEELLREDSAVSLGELNYQNVLRDPGYLRRVEAARRLGKRSNGHMAGVVEEDLVNALASAGLTDDHEVVNGDEAFVKLVRGVAVMVREGSSERNLADVVKGLMGRLRDHRLLMFCTDDKHPTDILREGHIDYNIRKSIEEGLDPIVAVQMATINPAMYFRLDHLVGSLAPGRKADVVVVDSLEKLGIRTVVFDGEVVYHEGRLMFEVPRVEIPEWARNTVRVNPALKAGDLVVKVGSESGKALVRVIEVTPGQILKKELREWLEVRSGVVVGDVGRDIIHIAVVERHKGLPNVGKGFVKGFGLKKGAIGSSVSHDHHNIVVVGVDPSDMYVAVRRLSEIGGGFVAVMNGEILAELPLEFAGLMSTRSYEEVVERLNRLEYMARHVLGSGLSSPFTQLEFVSLPSVPEIGITDRGLVVDYELVDPVVEVYS
jgi:adenine deaminase